jgi:hypothetical protein
MSDVMVSQHMTQAQFFILDVMGGQHMTWANYVAIQQGGEDTVSKSGPDHPSLNPNFLTD